MSEEGCDIEPRPRFKAQLKKNLDVHVPVNVIQGIKCSPGDYLTFEIIPKDAGHSQPFTTSHEIEVKQRMAEAEEIGVNTFNYYLPFWLQNFKDHLLMTHTKEIKSVDDIVPSAKKNKFGIVVGAGPSLLETTEEQWVKLRGFKGSIVATNKALVPLLKHGVVPDWVVALDGEEVVFKSFDDPIMDEYQGQINFLGPTVIHKKVTKFVLAWAKECYWGNPHMPSGHDNDKWNVNLVLELLNGLPVLRHGGNVGTCAWLLAKAIGCNPIGMYGFNLCVNPDDTWTREMASGYEYLYNADNKEVLALNGPFRAYVSILVGATDQAWNEEPPTRTVNLTPRGALFMSGFFPNITLEEFIKGKDVVKRADRERTNSLKRISEVIKEAQDAMKPIFRDDF